MTDFPSEMFGSIETIGHIMSFETVGQIPFRFGDFVEVIAAPVKAGGRPCMVVDLNPPNVSTPYPCVMLAWKDGLKTREGAMECKYLRAYRAS